MNTASTPTTKVLRITTSMSYRRYWRIAIPIEIGINIRTNPWMKSATPPLP